MNCGITRWKIKPSYNGLFSFWPVFSFVNSFVPSASPTKFATVFGASFSSKRTTMFPCEVSKTAYVPAARLMRSPFVLDHRTRARALRATAPRAFQMVEMSLLALLPALLLTKLRDMRGMMFPMPLVKEEQPINAALAMFGVNEDPCEMFRLQRAPQLDKSDV